MIRDKIFFWSNISWVDPSGNMLRRRECPFMFLREPVEIGRKELLRKGDNVA